MDSLHPPLRPHSNPVMARMGFLDLTAQPRVAALTRTVEALSQTRSPRQVLETLAQGMRRLTGPAASFMLSVRGLERGQFRILRLMGQDGVEHIPPADDLLTEDHLPIHSGGLIGQTVNSPTPKLAHHVDLTTQPELANVLGVYRSMLAVPIFLDGQPAQWLLLLHTDADHFSVEELEFAMLRGNLLGALLDSRRTAQGLDDARQRLRAEVARIAHIQKALLPDHVPDIPGLRTEVSYRTFDTAGGDLYDFLPLARSLNDPPDSHAPWGILIADASGHGPSAAVVMAMLHSIIHAYPQTPAGPAEMLLHANAHLCAKRIEQVFVTAFLALYDPNTRVLHYARAGHPPPVVKSPASTGRPLLRLDDAGGVPLGVLPDAEYDQARITLEPGQTLVLYTDGITESRGPTGEFFGVNGIERALTTCTGEPDCVIAWINSVLNAHEGGLQPTDDQTLVAIQVAPDPR